jgi:uncharacterized membrane protein YbhN (UPF0104 family)
MPGFMRTLLQPKVLIPTIIAIGVLTALLLSANVRRVLALMQGFPHLYLAYYLLLMLAYEIIRGVQWHFLLLRLGVRVPLQAQILSFAMGEITKSLPIGNYFQNYVLQQAEGVDFGRTSAASTLIILIEVLAACVGVVALGLGSWSVWLRPLILGGIGCSIILIVVARHFHPRGRLPARLRDSRAVRMAAGELHQFARGVGDLLRPVVLLVALILGLIYVTIAGLALFLVVQGLGGGLSIPAVLAVYYFSLAFSLIFPLPMDIGVAELSGVGAFAALGYDRSHAVGSMLVNRAVSLGSALAIAMVVVLVLRDELRLALRGGRRQRRRNQAAHRSHETPGV